jgi:hypothetical protein
MRGKGSAIAFALVKASAPGRISNLRHPLRRPVSHVRGPRNSRLAEHAIDVDVVERGVKAPDQRVRHRRS